MWLVLVLGSLVLPLLAGIVATGSELAPYLEFPPLTRAVAQPPFSPPVFCALASIVVAAVAPLALVGLRYRAPLRPEAPARPLPTWIWAGLALTGGGWLLAWSRLEWFADLQRHTFLPLWLGYIVIVNALHRRAAGWCLLIDHPRYLAALACVSTVFWWYFEFANRVTANWYYRGVETFGAGEYALFASLSFATVLPAVISTYLWLLAIPRLAGPYAGLRPLRVRRPRALGAGVWLLAVLGLAMLPLRPDLAYPLVWIAPLLVVCGARAACGQPTVFAALASGDWRPFALAPLAALGCGLCWELWNWRSLAHWEYAVPYVDRFHLFRMPLLGYAGYLPFGLECLAVALLVPGGRALLAPPAPAGPRR